jgi:hypothetical protein
MATSSLAHSAQETTTRVERGRQLFVEHAEQFLHKRGTWYVPSENGCSYYAVKLGPAETCECADYTYRGGSSCKHITAANTAQSKSAVCDCCGHRVLGRFVSEVEKADALLS